MSHPNYILAIFLSLWKMLFLSKLGFLHSVNIFKRFIFLLGSSSTFIKKKKNSINFQHDCVRHKNIYFFPNVNKSQHGLIRCEKNSWKCKRILTPPSSPGPPPSPTPPPSQTQWIPSLFFLHRRGNYQGRASQKHTP